MANRKTRESATKQKIASGRSKRTDLNLSFIDFRSRNSTKTRRTEIGLSEEFCRPLDELAGEDHSYVATRQERQRYEKSDLQLQFNHEQTFLQRCESFVR